MLEQGQAGASYEDVSSGTHFITFSRSDTQKPLQLWPKVV